MNMTETQINSFFSKIIKSDNEDDCWKWIGTKGVKGYGSFRYAPDNNAHRISYEYHNKRLIKKDMLILHSCDNPNCCNPNHLREGTHKENMRDRALRNRHNKQQVQVEQVPEIRNKFAKGNISRKELATEYNVSLGCITAIINRTTYNYI